MDSSAPPMVAVQPSGRVGVITLALAAAAWNVFGVVQFVHSLFHTRDSLMNMGMTAHQAEVYASYPAWMTVGFGVGTLGGLLGCVLILARRSSATPVLTASLAGYVVLYAGDITQGVFEALGAPQIAVLTLVVLVAAALLAWSRVLTRQGALA